MKWNEIIIGWLHLIINLVNLTLLAIDENRLTNNLKHEKQQYIHIHVSSHW